MAMAVEIWVKSEASQVYAFDKEREWDLSHIAMSSLWKELCAQMMDVTSLKKLMVEVKQVSRLPHILLTRKKFERLGSVNKAVKGQSQINNAVQKRSTSFKYDRDDTLCHIVIDGSNIAMAHGNDKIFSCKGIQLCVDYFLKKGHKKITAFVPNWRTRKPTPEHPISDQHILNKLKNMGYLVYSPAKLVDGNLIVCDYAKFILKQAVQTGGIVVSNDSYEDLKNQNKEWGEIIRNRVTGFVFVKDDFITPDDPLGQCHAVRYDQAEMNKPNPAEAKSQSGQAVAVPSSSLQNTPSSDELQTSFSPSPDDQVSSPEVDKASNLRYIVIDGSNVAMTHGNDKIFSCKGIKHCVDYYRKKGHKVTAFVPKWRAWEATPEHPIPDKHPISDQHILDELKDQGFLVYTPAKWIDGKLIVCYDDKFILNLAVRTGGIVVSNDSFKDLKNKDKAWGEIVRNRVTGYCIVDDYFMPPDDPYGKFGPHVDQFLQKSPPEEVTPSSSTSCMARDQELQAGPASSLNKKNAPGNRCPHCRQLIMGNIFMLPKDPGGEKKDLTSMNSSRKALHHPTKNHHNECPSTP